MGGRLVSRNKHIAMKKDASRNEDWWATELPQELLEIGMDLFNYVTDSVWSLNGSLASPKVMARYLVVASDESACSLNRPSWGEQKLRGLNVRGPSGSGYIGRPFCHRGTVPESIKVRIASR